MKGILCLCCLMFVLLPLSAIAEDKTSASAGDDGIIKTQSMIDSRVFLEKGGVEQMQTVSSKLNEESKMTLFDENKKIRPLGWLSLVVPSLGNWLVGDSVGGVVSVAGFAGSTVVYMVGYVQFYSSLYSATGSSSASSYNTVDTGGLYVMVAGLVLMIGFEIYSTASALLYADGYNNKLKAGLGITAIDSIEFDHRMTADNISTSRVSPELFHMNLLSYSF